VLVFNAVADINEFDVATLTGTITDPGTLDTFTLVIDWGDPLSPNNVETYTFPASATGSQTFTLTHQYVDDNPTGTPSATYTISATVTDDDTGSGTASQTVTVHNVAPAVSADTSTQGVQYSDSIQTITFTATDVPLDVLNAQVFHSVDGGAFLPGLPDADSISGMLSFTGAADQQGTERGRSAGLATWPRDLRVPRRCDR
jgi:hypothetical protein